MIIHDAIIIEFQWAFLAMTLILIWDDVHGFCLGILNVILHWKILLPPIRDIRNDQFGFYFDCTLFLLDYLLSSGFSFKRCTLSQKVFFSCTFRTILLLQDWNMPKESIVFEKLASHFKSIAKYNHFIYFGTICYFRSTPFGFYSFEDI